MSLTLNQRLEMRVIDFTVWSMIEYITERKPMAKPLIDFIDGDIIAFGKSLYGRTDRQRYMDKLDFEASARKAFKKLGISRTYEKLRIVTRASLELLEKELSGEGAKHG